MKLDSAKSVWAGRGIAWVILLVVSCGLILFSTFALGPALFSNDSAGRSIALAVFCPGAVSSTEQQGASTQTTTSPTGTYGRTVEVTCTLADGTIRTIRNEQYALASIGGMFAGGALVGVVLSLPLFLIPFFLFRRKKSAAHA